MIILKNKKDLLTLVGPTATGKTSISIELAKNIGGEIISADSMQIYRYMDIGTAKATIAEMKEVPHYLIDVVDPDEEFTVAQYRDKANKYIADIDNRGSFPMVVGGTGLYLNSLVYELRFTNVKPDQEFRKKYDDMANLYGNEYLYRQLQNVDPISAKRINHNDRQRIIRALEIFHNTGKPMSYFNKNFRKKTDKYNLIMIALTMDRADLYSRINTRVDQMIQDGLIDEVRGLLDMGYDKGLVSMKAIGYKEIIPYIEGQITLDRAIELLKRNTRRYAKRQMTWFRRDNRIKWIHVDRFDSTRSIVSYIIEYMNRSLNYFRGEDYEIND
ncbi:MAG: tRNA (adenosine(37)-N6)-dimethylallyltransferase MiaA [Tissierellia bacterium]|nr:tRNA (adenosine(37)-N6)-dimethylallyltransferase MiaA [Tissierellia bacterium]